ncbi:septum formation initiator family protein [Flavobacteriaceae bacterium AU392]|nr:septum formation initiator family protein [Flavobacteriaceae bacterium]RKM83654.1 septum formation initiator family protein [Flavobacteriaceae bacterium AU392]
MLKFPNKYKRFLKPFKNLFFLIFIVFSVWMLFFDSNSWFIHNELNEDIKDLEAEKAYYQNEIQKDQKDIKKLSNDKGIEKYGREKYHMKKDNEEIYIIEYEDSIKIKNENE